MATYTVVAGDTLGRIARRFGQSVAALLQANPQIRNPDVIVRGQVLTIPGGASPAAVAGWPQRGLPAPGSGARLRDADLARAAGALGCEVAAVRAVAAVESSGAGFLPSGRPKILFEAHVFARETGHRFNASHPGISSRRWNRALYGPAGEHQYSRLRQAQELAHVAALRSASWGLFQIMGFNHGAAGYGSVGDYIAAMFTDEGRHLDAVVGFVRTHGLHRALRERDWRAFARGYNGSGAVDDYAPKLRRAYERFAG